MGRLAETGLEGEAVAPRTQEAAADGVAVKAGLGEGEEEGGSEEMGVKEASAAAAMGARAAMAAKGVAATVAKETEAAATGEAGG